MPIFKYFYWIDIELSPIPVQIDFREINPQFATTNGIN